MAFARNLRMLLGVHDLDAGGFAERIGTSPTSVSYWLNAKREPSAENLVHLAGWFHVDAGALLREPPEQFVIRVGDPERFAQVERFLDTYEKIKPSTPTPIRRVQ